MIKSAHSYALKLIFPLFFMYNQVLAIRFDQTTFNSDITITMFDNDVCVGFASYRKIPMTSWYAIHSLYVYPKFRRKGYGASLTNHICKLLKNLKATRAYIQPGPFELKDGKSVSVGNLYKQKMRDLIKFYEKLVFRRVSFMMSKIASILYYFKGIYEDPSYLMVKNL